MVSRATVSRVTVSRATVSRAAVSRGNCAPATAPRDSVRRDVQRDRCPEAQERGHADEPAGAVARAPRDHARDRDDHQQDREDAEPDGEGAHATYLS